MSSSSDHGSGGSLATTRYRLQAEPTDEPIERAPRWITVYIDGPRLIKLVLIVAVAFEVLFVLGDIFINRFELIDINAIERFWNIAREDGVASWFGTMQTWMVGLTAILLYLVQRHDLAKPTWRRLGWLIVGGVLLYLAMDDGAEFHERVGTAVTHWFGDPDSDGPGLSFFPSYVWQVVFLPLLSAFAVFVLFFVYRELEVRADRLLVVASLFLLVLAVALDFTEGLDIEHALNAQRFLVEGFGWPQNGVRHYAKAFEEFIEMLAMTLLWVALLRHLVRVAPRMGFNLESDSARM